MSTVASALINSVSNLLQSKPACTLTECKEILKIGNILNSLLIETSSVSIPRIVSVGSQSSGKSSMLNSIIGLDILPTGSNMVTRTPLHLELIQTVDGADSEATFGHYESGQWCVDQKIPFQYPDLGKAEKRAIYNAIIDITNTKAGTGMNISLDPIYLRIKNPFIPNLSLVDLPGLTMVACTDRGQPKDIKEQIRTMIGHYIQDPNTLILAVMPARTDIEADIALDLIKEYDPEGMRTIGCLTKLDLMNDGTNVCNLLENNVSRDLQLHHGYFGIRNRSKQDMQTLNLRQGLQLEQDYFLKHPVYSNPKYKSNLGTESLCRTLSHLLVNQIKKCLPEVIHDINTHIEKNQHKLLQLGEPLPESDSAKTSYIHTLLSNFSRQFTSVLNTRGNIINTARNIKQAFIHFRKELGKLAPFTAEECPDQYIQESIENCEGNHMSFPSPPIEVMEQILTDQSRQPLRTILHPSKECSNNIMNELIVLCNILIEQTGIIRFPHLQKRVKELLIQRLILDNYTLVCKKIQELIDMQENYVWTDNEHFQDILTTSSEASMRDLLGCYFQTVVETMQDMIPKCIMLFLVKRTQNEIGSELYSILKNGNVSELLEEYSEIATERQNLIHSTEKFKKAKTLIESIM